MPPTTGTTQPEFEKDEKVFCFHYELLYEAKIVDVAPVDPKDKKAGLKYKVHYKGWKNTWDDWVSYSQLRKATSEYRKLAARLKKDLDDSKKRSKTTNWQKIRTESGPSTARASEDRAVTGMPNTSGSARLKRRDAQMEKEEHHFEKVAVLIPLPDSIKSILVDDWENVTKETKLVPLPSQIPISTVLREYFEYESRHRDPNSAEYDVLREVVDGLKAYFTKCIGKILLYKEERKQFASIFHMTEDPTGELAGKGMVDIYGAEHLLRLLSILPDLIAKTNMDMPSVNRLRDELTKFNFWLGSSEAIDRYLSTPYEQWSQEDVALTRLPQTGKKEKALAA